MPRAKLTLGSAAMKPLSRRSVTTGIVAAVTAIPAVGLATSLRAHPGDDKLLAAIRRYKSEVAAINASHGLTDEERRSRRRRP
jgi:hypothetical protein